MAYKVKIEKVRHTVGEIVVQNRESSWWISAENGHPDGSHEYPEGTLWRVIGSEMYVDVENLLDGRRARGCNHYDFDKL